MSRERSRTPLVLTFALVSVGVWVGFYLSVLFRIWFGYSLYFLPFDVAGFLWIALLPFVVPLQGRLQRHYPHLLEYHPWLARMVWEPALGPRPLPSPYRGLTCYRHRPRAARRRSR